MGLAPVHSLQSIAQSLAISLLVRLLHVSPYCGLLLSGHRCDGDRAQSVRGRGNGRGSLGERKEWRLGRDLL